MNLLHQAPPRHSSCSRRSSLFLHTFSPRTLSSMPWTQSRWFPWRRIEIRQVLGQGFTKAIIRGYAEACSIGGQVDSNFVQSYKNARAAGYTNIYTNIDTYWTPCTGSTSVCKPFAVQLLELTTIFTLNNMRIGKIWINIESDRVACNPVRRRHHPHSHELGWVAYNDDDCLQWDYGATGNVAKAKALISAIRATRHEYGIHSTVGVRAFFCTKLC